MGGCRSGGTKGRPCRIGRAGQGRGVSMRFELPEDPVYLLDGIWQRLEKAAGSVGHPWRTPVVATTGPDGPAARVVVLRSVDPARRALEFHTDARSPKVADIGADPRVAWTFYDPAEAIQIRAVGLGAVVTDGVRVRAAWERVPSSSRSGYSTTQPPGSVLAAADLEAGLLPEQRHHFAVVETVVASLDWLWLAPGGPRRAGFIWTRGAWGGCWRVP